MSLHESTVLQIENNASWVLFYMLNLLISTMLCLTSKNDKSGIPEQ